MGWVSAFVFFLAKFHQERKFKIQKLSDFESFQSHQKWGGKIFNPHISILGFQCVAQNMEGRNLVYSQNWLNLPKDDIATFG
jgi:hypothetical protein